VERGPLKTRLIAATIATVALTLPAAADADLLGIQTPDVPGVPDVEGPNVPGPAGQIVDDVVRNVNDATGSVAPPAVPAPPVTPPVGGTEPADPSRQGGSSGGGNREGESGQASSGPGGPGSDRRATGTGERERRVDPAAAAIGAPADDEAESLPEQFFKALEALPLSLLLALLAIAALGIAMAIRSAWLAALARRLRRHERELEEDVGVLQAALLPGVPERLGDVELSLACRSADGPAAGGDFYDVLQLDDRTIAVLVGDVSGHGKEALTATALVHYTLRAYLEAGTRPRQALRLADHALKDRLGDHYATVVAAVYDVPTATLEYATAGHPAPLILDGDPDRLVPGLSPPIGIGPSAGSRDTIVSLRPGSRVCFFTDGLIEATTGGEERLERDGLEGMIADLNGGCDADALLERLQREAEVSDDATVLLVQPDTAGGDGTIVEEVELQPSAAESLPGFLESCGMTEPQVEATMAQVLHRLDGRQRSLLKLTRRDGQVDWELSDNRRLREISSLPTRPAGRRNLAAAS
jgi:serine phosphatase RsbU (regulator of sigma subunit)